MKCPWCGEGDEGYHNECGKEMESGGAKIKNGILYMNDEKLQILLKFSDIGRQLYLRFKNRDRTKISRTQILNNKLNVEMYEPDEPKLDLNNDEY